MNFYCVVSEIHILRNLDSCVSSKITLLRTRILFKEFSCIYENFWLWFNIIGKCALVMLNNQPNFNISPIRAPEPFSAFLFVFCVWPSRYQVRIDWGNSPPLTNTSHLPNHFDVHFPKWKSRECHLNLDSDNLLLKFLLKWNSGDNANSAVTAHSHNGQDGKLVGRELKAPWRYKYKPSSLPLHQSSHSQTQGANHVGPPLFCT